jgi:hypothetical protein
MTKRIVKILPSVLFLLVIGLVMTSQTCEAYKQPAYITNIYFFNKPVMEGEKVVKPSKTINGIKANEPKALANLRMNLVGDKGSHKIVVDILDKRGRSISKPLKFEPFSAPTNNHLFTANSVIGGKLPEGGIFLKVFDTLNKGKKTALGTFRIMTVK